MDGQGTKCRRNIAENSNRLSRAHERYRQTDRQTTDGRQQIANVNVSSRSLKMTETITIQQVYFYKINTFTKTNDDNDGKLHAVIHHCRAVPHGGGSCRGAHHL